MDKKLAHSFWRQVGRLCDAFGGDGGRWQRLAQPAQLEDFRKLLVLSFFHVTRSGYIDLCKYSLRTMVGVTTVYFPLLLQWYYTLPIWTAGPQVEERGHSLKIPKAGKV